MEAGRIGTLAGGPDSMVAGYTFPDGLCTPPHLGEIINDGTPDNWVGIGGFVISDPTERGLWRLAATLFHEGLHLLQVCQCCGCEQDHGRIYKAEAAFWSALAAKVEAAGGSPADRAWLNRQAKRAGERANEKPSC